VFFGCEEVIAMMIAKHGQRAKVAVTTAKRDLELIEATRSNSEASVKVALKEAQMLMR
jgi:hypothetical protein